jgi:hypothetical protein
MLVQEHVRKCRISTTISDFDATDLIKTLSQRHRQRHAVLKAGSKGLGELPS